MQIHIDETEYTGGIGRNLDESVVKCCNTYKYLGTNNADKGGRKEENKHKIAKGKVEIRQLHSIIIRNKIITKM